MSTDRNRSLRLGIVGFLNFLGNGTAYFSSSYILNATNITFVFVIAFSIAIAGFLWAIFIVDDSIISPQGASKCDQWREIFSHSRIREIFNSLCKRRPQKCRKILWALMIIPTLVVATMHGNGTTNYLFVREKFEWSLREWTTFESTNTLITVSGLFIGLMLLKKVFKLSDMTLGTIGLLSSLVDALFKAFATKSYHLYISSAVTLFRLMSTPMLRAVMSVAVPHHEIGKVYSLVTCFECLSGLFAGPLYTTVYNNTFTFFPGAFHLITASAFAINLVLVGFIVKWKSQGVTNEYD